MSPNLKSNLTLYADGSSTGKVGEGGWGFVLLEEEKVIHEDHGGADKTTNNRMELSAVIEGLRYIYSEFTAPCIVVYSDSQYVVKGINEYYVTWGKKIASGKLINQDLWIEFKLLTELFENLTLKWVKGHSGVEYNERCDMLAKQGKLEIKASRDEKTSQ